MVLYRMVLYYMVLYGVLLYSMVMYCMVLYCMVLVLYDWYFVTSYVIARYHAVFNCCLQSMYDAVSVHAECQHVSCGADDDFGFRRVHMT